MTAPIQPTPSGLNPMPPLPVGTLTPDTKAVLRRQVREAMRQGYQASEINEKIEQLYGKSIKDVMGTGADDIFRGLAQGVTLGHFDELAGAVAKAGGGNYTAIRDAVRTQDAAYAEGNQVANFALQAAGGLIPGMIAAPIAGITKGATLLNAAKGAAVGGGLGAVAGEGNSDASGTDLVKPTAFGALVGAGFGGATSAIASTLAGRGIPKGNAAAVGNEVAGQLPDDVTQLKLLIGRQEQLAPGTATLADLSPQMQRFVRAIGADQPTAIREAGAVAKRITRLKTALKGVGAQYDQLKGITEPADPQITNALEAVGRRGDLIQNGKVNLADLHDLRGILLKNARRTPDENVARINRDMAQAITDWMADPSRAPWIRQVDADYAFLRNRLGATEDTRDVLLKSHAAHSVNRAAGVDPGSVGGELPVPGGTRVGTTLLSFLKPDKAARAKAIAQLLLTPQKDATALDGLLATRSALLQSQSAPFLNAASQGVTAGATQGILSSP